MPLRVRQNHSAVYPRHLTLVLLFYGVLGLALLKYYQYQINPDGVSYISIARKYLAGEFGDAVNGIWGPLFPWLLVPFLLMDLQPLLAAKVVSLIIGCFLIVSVERLSYRFEMTEPIRTAVLLSLVPITLYFSMSIITPDLLLTCVIVFYLTIIFSDRYGEGRFDGVKCGALGAAAYFAKGYGLPFFLSHFLLFNTLHYYIIATEKYQRRKVVQNLLIGAVVFFVLCAPWIVLLSQKYGEITFSTAGKYNHALVGPHSEGFFYGQPHYQWGFLEPPNETAVSEWEDPSLHEMEQWSPWDSWTSFVYQIKLLARNLLRTVIVFESFSVFSLLILPAALWYVFQGFVIKKVRVDFFFTLLTIFLYSSGFTLFHVEDRYLWVNWVLLLLMGGNVLAVIKEYKWMNSTHMVILVALLAVSFVGVPVVKLFQDADSGREIYNLSRKLAEKQIQGNITSNTRWRESMFISFYLNARYYGIPKKGIDEHQLEVELKKFDIDYYLVWDESDQSSQLSQKYREITQGEIPGLKVYSIDEALVGAFNLHSEPILS